MAAITASGHKVTTQKTKKYAACDLYIDSKHVWSCDITSLEPAEGPFHPLCAEAVKAIEAHQKS
ncbi:hypothetical protein KP79_PYT06055 [Mizuhopecten yessoensis]|uniref:Uncharacterized protein n=1 Tax=Mizuhopecten yessoensis TaxID=6573 RepID=A0A210PM04_MIZYE|nr:hypothetical protein KP79_PYT06055 [Mizuhopecten yessoensis]